MDGRTAIAVYLAFGFFLNSALHSWYVSNTLQNVRFAIPFSEYKAGLPPFYGYVGAVVIGLTVFWIAWLFASSLAPLDSLAISDLLVSLRTGLILIVLVFPLSQFIGGASWSKLVLDGLVVLTGLFVLMSYVHRYSFLELVGTYISLLALIVAIGGLWLSQYIEELQAGTFPSAAYFGIASLYVLVGSLYLIFQNLIESV